MQDVFEFIDTCKAELVSLGYERKSVVDDEDFIRRSEELLKAGHTGVQAANIMHNERIGR